MKNSLLILKQNILFQLTLPKRIYAVYKQKGLLHTLYDIYTRLSFVTIKKIHLFLLPQVIKIKYAPNASLTQLHAFYNRKESMNKPEIILFIDSLGAGGAERQIVRLALELKKQGFKASIITQHLGKEHSHYLPLALSGKVQVSSFSIWNFICGLKYVHDNKLTKYYTQIPPAIRIETIQLIGKIHAKTNCILHCYLDTPNITGGFVGILTGTPTRLSIRNVNPGFFWPESAPCMQSAYTSILKHPLIKLESNCKNNYDNYAQWLNISMPCSVIHNGIELSDVTATISRQDMRKQLSIPETAPMILFIGRLSHEKNPLDFVLVADKVSSIYKDAYFIHAGTGPLEQDLKQLIQDKQLKHRIHLLGRRDDIPNLLHASNILLLTSQIEGMPNAVMEAMAAAIPVVSTRVGAVPELIEENVHGFTADPGDIEALSKAVIQLIENPTLAKRMGLAGQQRIKEHFSTEKLVQKVIAAYEAELS